MSDWCRFAVVCDRVHRDPADGGTATNESLDGRCCDEFLGFAESIDRSSF